MANKTTKDHGEIRRWAEERGGRPSHSRDLGSTEDIGILRIDFPGYSGQGSLETVTWEAWFDKFDERNLALLYQDETAEGHQIVTPETAREAETGAGRGTRARRGGSRAKRAPIKKAAAKKGAAKKGAAKKSAAKKGARPSASTKKKAAKRPTTRHAARRTSRSRTAGAKRSAAKTSSARSRSSASRGSRKRSAARKSSTKKRR